MRQNITINQLHDFIQLNQETHEFNDERFDALYQLLRIPEDRILNERLLTIGVMLDVIEREVYCVSSVFNVTNEHKWLIDVQLKNQRKMQVARDELCDCLWEVFKEICIQKLKDR